MSFRVFSAHDAISCNNESLVPTYCRRILFECLMAVILCLLQAGAGSALTESSQMPRDIDLSPSQPLQSSQPSGSLGVIGRRSVADLGAIGDNLSVSPATSGGMHDQLYNLQMLESSFYKLPQPKDSERAKSYTPV